jgi:hypothetical protein
MNYKEKFLKIVNYFTKKNGKYVRTKNGQKIEEWFKDNELHREDGPASYYLNDKISRYYKEEWYQNGVLHRTDGPAIKDNAGYSEYWINGKKHRTDGPAVIKDDADQYYLEWWFNGEKLSYEAFQSLTLHEELQKETQINKNQPKKLKI